ncbi:hypothetical protein GALL_194790 [mine drainage metagenome]|uniref:Uncharacterized protein n=1 Tax=mine drainage metagenome TaxID=410659 RepID=A0A1J5RQC7_9ZZZZ
MSDKDLYPTTPQIQRLVESGRAAIVKRLLRAVLSPIDKENIDAEVAEITALLDKYNEVMAAYEKPKTAPTPETSADEDGSKG